MDLKGEQRIGAPREAVFDALNDPDILRQCIPGCESLERDPDGTMNAAVALRIGPVKATFKGKVTLSNVNRPDSFSISGEGRGGPAGFARGGADIELAADGDATILRYAVTANVGGKLAQLGGRLVDSTANMLSGKFFEKFREIVEGAAPAEGGGAKDGSMASAARWARDPRVWIPCLAVAVIVVLLLAL